MLCLRYINDVFMIWKGIYGHLTNFLDSINKQHQIIKFDFVI